jgi:hypothetical protein
LVGKNTRVESMLVYFSHTVVSYGVDDKCASDCQDQS